MVHEREQKLVVACLILLALGYAVQVVSPLRINTDSYRLLSMAVSANHGQGYLVDGQTDQFPLAYPFVVRLLLRTGLASSSTLITVNLVCLLIALVVLRSWSGIGGGSVRSMLPLVLVLSSWVMVKHVTIPLSEFPYLATSLLTLCFAGLDGERHGLAEWCFLGIALLFALVALQCRSAGVALLPVLALVAILHRDSVSFTARPFAKWRYILAIVGLSALLTGVVWLFVSQTGWYELEFARTGSYWQSLLDSYQGENTAAMLIRNARYRVLEFGNVFANSPSNRAARLLPIYYLVGLVSWCAVLYGTWLLLRAKRLLPLALYFLSYSALMFIWPYFDARFWLPLLPVLAVLFFSAVDDLARRWPAIRHVLRAYLAGFVVLGIVALLYSTRISLSGREFSELYGDGTYTMTYRFAFQNGKEVDLSQVSPGQVQLLRIFEPLAAPGRSGESNPEGDSSD